MLFAFILYLSFAIVFASAPHLFLVTFNTRLGYDQRKQFWSRYNVHHDRHLFENPATYLLSAREYKANRIANDIRVASVVPFLPHHKSSILSTKNNIDDVVRTSNASQESTTSDSQLSDTLKREVNLICLGDPIHDQQTNESVAVDLLQELSISPTHSNDPIELEVTTACFYNKEDCPNLWEKRMHVLQKLLGYDHTLVDDAATEGSSRVLVLRIPQFIDLCSITKRVASQQHVVRVEVRDKMVTLNAFAAAAVQSGAEEAVNMDNAVIWKAGIMGQGEIVGVGDTGVDMDSCYFRELPKETGKSFNGTFQQKASAEDGVCDFERRKVVCYFTTPKATFGDDSSMLGGGHGTHVTGTIGGLHAAALNISSLEPNKFLGRITGWTPRGTQMNGVAPLSKLSVNDLGGDAGRLYPPVDFATSPFLSAPYARAGMRIHSNSWGCGGGGKSVRTCNKYSVLARSMDEFMWLNKDSILVVAAGNSGDVGIVDLDSQALPRYKDGYYTVGGPATFKNGIAVGATQRGEPTRACASAGGDGEPCSLENLFTASSRGPTLDGRIKPEIVFPGEKITSAFSSGDPIDRNEGSCMTASLYDGVHIISGTSMACPGLAGALALVRQYFREINPATGIRSSYLAGPLSDGYGPSGALLKATVIASAAPLTGHFTYRTAPKAPRQKELIHKTKNPAFIAGFGRPQLNRVLRLSGSSRVRLLVFDRFALGNNDKPNTHSFKVWRGGKWKAVLTYTDAPGPVQDVWGAGRVLVNDLDMSASCAQIEDCDVLDENLKSESRIDNIEMLPIFDGKKNAVEVLKDTVVTIRVSPRSVVSKLQPYALVVSGTRLEFREEGSTQPNWTPDWSASVKQPAGGTTQDIQNMALNVAIGVVTALAACICVGAIWYCCRRNEPQKTVGEPVAG